MSTNRHYHPARYQYEKSSANAHILRLVEQGAEYSTVAAREAGAARARSLVACPAAYQDYTCT
jgi:hypothetical protein